LTTRSQAAVGCSPWRPPIPGVCAERVPALRPIGSTQLASCFLYHRDEHRDEAVEP
jgi:hypothetical protein